MNVINETLKLLRDKILVCDMNFDLETSAGGIILPSDDGKTSGIHPRWARVFAVGPEQKDVNVGDWILLEHGRWSRGFHYEDNEGKQYNIRLADKDAILMISDEKPIGAMRAESV